METETIDKLFLELSQITKAKSERELNLEAILRAVRNRVRLIKESHYNGYDFNADPKQITLAESDAFEMIAEALGEDAYHAHNVGGE